MRGPGTGDAIYNGGPGQYGVGDGVTEGGLTGPARRTLEKVGEPFMVLDEYVPQDDWAERIYLERGMTHIAFDTPSGYLKEIVIQPGNYPVTSVLYFPPQTDDHRNLRLIDTNNRVTVPDEELLPSIGTSGEDTYGPTRVISDHIGIAYVVTAAIPEGGDVRRALSEKRSGFYLDYADPRRNTDIYRREDFEGGPPPRP